MGRKSYFGIAAELLAVAVGIWLTMVGSISPFIGWPIISICVISGIYLIITGIKKSDRATIDRNKKLNEKWAHYRKLVNLILQTETEPHEKWGEIVADIQRELNAIEDRMINKYMRLYFPVIDEEEHFGMKPSRITKYLLLTKSASVKPSESAQNMPLLCNKFYCLAA